MRIQLRKTIRAKFGVALIKDKVYEAEYRDGNYFVDIHHVSVAVPPKDAKVIAEQTELSV